jgi:N-ethylmaleimide reductase
MNMQKMTDSLKLGRLALRNRFVMAPMTRSRAKAGGVPSDSAPLYYGQRASAGLIISEGAPISPEAVGNPGVPGLWSPEQIEGWKQVTQAVHGHGSLIVAQICHAGRASHPSLQPGGKPAGAPSAIAIDGTVFTEDGFVPHVVPRELGANEIARIVDHYAAAARNALEAGFDGIEIHAANGYLIDQFLQDGSNRRQDGYGGSLAKRTRLLNEVVDAVTSAVGADSVGVRISPSSTFQSMSDSDPDSLWTRVLEVLSHYDLAYVHAVEPSISGADPSAEESVYDARWIRARYAGNIVAAGEFTMEQADLSITAGSADAIAFGRSFISNPDLPQRLLAGARLTEWNRDHFYGRTDKGYIDYPTLEEEDAAIRRA